MSAADLLGIPLRIEVQRFDLSRVEVDIVRRSDVLIASDDALSEFDDLSLRTLSAANATELIVSATRTAANRLVTCQSAAGARLCPPARLGGFLKSELVARARPAVDCIEIVPQAEPSEALRHIVGNLPFLGRPSVKSLTAALGGTSGPVDGFGLYRICRRLVGLSPAELIARWTRLAMARSRRQGATWQEVADLFGYGSGVAAHSGYGPRDEPRPPRGAVPWVLEPPRPAPAPWSG